MKRMFLFSALMLMLGTLAADAQNRFIRVYQNGTVVQSFPVEDVDSIIVETEYAGAGEAVDLGLPSGTLWADRNIGADSPEGYGDYFAWGETSPKSVYNWSTYKYCKGSSSTMTKYCTNSSLGTVDNKTVLEPADDAATANWGDRWRMPTHEEQKELIEKCTWTWTTSNGVNGYKVVGPNGNSIFLPAAGCRRVSSVPSTGSSGYYWSASLREIDPQYAWRMLFSSDSHISSGSGRWLGHSVRAVARKNFETEYAEKTSFTVNGVSFNMIAVKGGTFTMGATSEQGSDARDDEKPTHQVTLSDYCIGETEVTQELWQAVMGSNPSYFTGNLQRPVEYVSWNDCQEFIKKLNQLTGKTFRLPTEAEWEYAARGGSQSQGYKYAGSNTIGDVAWYTSNSSSTTHPVGQKQANELGLYDMSGNVCEWCQDWYGSYSSSSQTNPTGPSSGSIRVGRGGSWLYYARYCRVSYRFYGTPTAGSNVLGFRLAL